MDEFEIGKWLWTAFAPSHFLLLILALAVFTTHRWVNEFFTGLVTLALVIIAILPVGDWVIGEANGKNRTKLSFPTRALAWAGDGLWSLEDGEKIKPAPGKADKPAAADPFGPRVPPPPYTPPRTP